MPRKTRKARTKKTATTPKDLSGSWNEKLLRELQKEKNPKAEKSAKYIKRRQEN